MKKILCALLAIIPLAGVAQTGHPVELTVLNRNGEATTNRNIIAFVKSQYPSVYPLGGNGSVILPDVASGDTVAVVIRHRIYEFPAAGTNTLELLLNRRERVTSVLRNGMKLSAGGYNVVPVGVSSPDVSVNDMNNPSQYLSLADYLEGRIPGLVITGGPGNYQAYLDGTVPLVILNGIRVRDFNAANMLVNPSDIQSVTVDRNGVIYGSAGMNGVLIITTK